MPVFRAFALTAATAVLAAAPSAQAASFLSVGPDSLCGAGGCLTEARRTFTQSFGAGAGAAGGGLQGISTLSLDRRLVGEMQHHAVRVTFELADGTVVDWGKFTLAVLSGDVVTLGGQTFNWDPSLGALTVRLDLVLPEKGGAGGGPFGGGAFGGGQMGMGAGPSGGSFAGLPPTAAPFSAPPMARPGLSNSVFAAAIPEPGTWAMLIAGMGLTGAMLRNRARHLRYAK